MNQPETPKPGSQQVVNCPRCGKNKWKSIPDSLAEYCPCGEVRVLEDDGTYSRGASLQEWTADLVKSRAANDPSSATAADGNGGAERKA